MRFCFSWGDFLYFCSTTVLLHPEFWRLLPPTYTPLHNLLLYYSCTTARLLYYITVLLLYFYCTTTVSHQASDVVDCGGECRLEASGLQSEGFYLVVILE